MHTHTCTRTLRCRGEGSAGGHGPAPTFHGKQSGAERSTTTAVEFGEEAGGGEGGGGKEEEEEGARHGVGARGRARRREVGAVRCCQQAC